MSVTAFVGQTGLFLAALAGVLGVISTLRPTSTSIGSRRWTPLSVGVTVLGILVAFASLEVALIRHDFSLVYVANNNATTTPLLFSISGLWASLEGSLLLWAFVLATYLGAFVWTFRRVRNEAVVRWAIAVQMVVLLFFVFVMLAVASPFASYAPSVVPQQGLGPNPLLGNHLLMAFHPPILYAGYVGLTIPFSLAVGALVTGRFDEQWLVRVRRWTLVSWIMLTVGILFGAWWSYEVLGWGGYWAWDPVENASLLPWLAATAYLHSVVLQERRHMLRLWNLGLIGAAFALTILGTYFTRSGALRSVHAFSESGIGVWFLLFFVTIVIGYAALLYWRVPQLSAPGAVKSHRSREAMLLWNNVAFSTFAGAVFVGTVFPLVVNRMRGDDLTIGAAFFDPFARAFGAFALLLLTVTPAMIWGVTPWNRLSRRLLPPAIAGVGTMVSVVASGLARSATHSAGGPVWFTLLAGLVGAALFSWLWLAFVRVRSIGWRGVVGRSGGSVVVHTGVMIAMIGVLASQSFAERTERHVAEGQTVHAFGHAFTLVALRTVESDAATSLVADVSIDGGQAYAPRVTRMRTSTNAIGTPSVKSTPLRDIYLTIVQTPGEGGNSLGLGITVTPLVPLIWIGGCIAALGAMFALYRKEQPA